MWIKPEHGSGSGRLALFMHARERSAALKLPVMELSADPNAEGFINEWRGASVRLKRRLTVSRAFSYACQSTLILDYKKEPPG
jgi:hypothetical protein